MKAGGHQLIGLIAEEVAEVDARLAKWGADLAFDETGTAIPDALLSDDRAPFDLDDRALISTLINAVQELKIENDQLKLRIEALED